jgi:hypothetical protein
MATIHSEASAIINAKAETIYTIISDYRNEHAKMLPPEYFRDLVVEAGGKGEGTIITFTTHVGGQDQHFRMRITEPQPGRVLAENDTASSMVTTFTLTPLDDGNQTRVQIASDRDPGKGLRGIIEKMMVPQILTGIYEKQLRQLADVVSAKS